jgi:murein DD-endopeptidase MepM/ murein hydrolase activator NlpD
VYITRRLPPPIWVIAVLALTVVTVPPADATTRWVWPIVGPVIRAFDKPETDYSNGHRGIDIGAIRGREVRSPVDGVVWFSGVVAGRPVISIDTADGSIVSLEPVESSVVRGDVVRAGDSIGLVSAQHDGMNAIHLGVRVDGVYVDPMQFLGNPPRIVVYDSWIEAYALG